MEPEQDHFHGGNNMVNSTVIGSLGDLLNFVCGYNPDNKRSLWYRGHGVRSWNLAPPILRKENKETIKESNINYYFQVYASSFMEAMPDPEDYSSWITLMQHYGLPTRLLDWSRSPLLAAFFAVFNDKHLQEEGCIWLLDPLELNEYESEGEEILLYHMQHNIMRDLIYPAFKNEPQTELYKKFCKDKVFASYPAVKNIRVHLQQSAFTVHNSERTLIEIADANRSDTMLQELKIPAKSKPMIKKELVACGIIPSMVYPDLEHVAQDIINGNVNGNV